MPAFSFTGTPSRGPFWKLIQTGEKTLTTRKVRKRGGPRVGQTAYLYWKQRVAKDRKPIHLIGRSTITKVMRYRNMRRLILSLGIKGTLEYVKAEGFKDLGELVAWWAGEKPSGYGVMAGGVLLDEETWEALMASGPVEVIEWAYPFPEEEET